MQLDDFLDCDAIKTALPGGNKRSLFKQLAELAAQRTGVEAAGVLTSLNEREQLGSTGFGQGVAIPHPRSAGRAKSIAWLCASPDPSTIKRSTVQPVTRSSLPRARPG